MGLTLADLPALNRYRDERTKVREQVSEARKHRRVNLGEHVVLLFENRETILFQIMEMLHIENKDGTSAREEELLAYNPLITDANNLKATMQIEYPDSEERKEKLVLLNGIEARMWCKVDGCDAVYAVADEDMPRSDEKKTSAVHFLRYPLESKHLAKLSEGATLDFGCDHPHYDCSTGPLPTQTRSALLSDLQIAPP